MPIIDYIQGLIAFFQGVNQKLAASEEADSALRAKQALNDMSSYCQALNPNALNETFLMQVDSADDTSVTGYALLIMLLRALNSFIIQYAESNIRSTVFDELAEAAGAARQQLSLILMSIHFHPITLNQPDHEQNTTFFHLLSYIVELNDNELRNTMYAKLKNIHPLTLKGIRFDSTHNTNEKSIYYLIVILAEQTGDFTLYHNVLRNMNPTLELTEGDGEKIAVLRQDLELFLNSVELTPTLLLVTFENKETALWYILQQINSRSDDDEVNMLFKKLLKQLSAEMIAKSSMLNKATVYDKAMPDNVISLLWQLINRTGQQQFLPFIFKSMNQDDRQLLDFISFPNGCEIPIVNFQKITKIINDFAEMTSLLRSGQLNTPPHFVAQFLPIIDVALQHLKILPIDQQAIALSTVLKLESNRVN